ncbi:hypothetical protein GON03_19000 [Nocardioides sp. MAH-18]|uniref:Uncharacterized protein n=1 Tax=Nocardioides agri TaxID=2682843 RepID=A0A6L6XV62_9ACTN|nr:MULTISPECIES: hypothetical protein [unclassified Nocardioides]MBA2952105.1 hypothetical protein [Nocardioides sp. CGMCC 1.13656]MVQ51274.1 hypothetical protein [Nocardioides sp. MAH-18]
MRSLSVKIGGVWLSILAPSASYGPVTIEYGKHGSEAASWTMDPDFRHPLLRGNQLVQIYEAGLCVWIGTLLEPGSTGEYEAIGLWHQAETALAMDSSNVPTTVPDAAIAGAGARGEISWGGSVSAATWGGTSPDPKMKLAYLLDNYANENGLRWSVTPNALIVMQADPTTPLWVVPHVVAGRGLTPADDEFATHLVGTYLSGASTYSTRTIGSAAAANAFGRKTKWVDLTPMGVITPARADSVLTGMFLLAGARMGWAEGLELSSTQLTNLGGTRAPFVQVRSLQLVRLAGTIDTSRANQMPAYTDIVIGGSRYTDGSDQITITPMGFADRSLEGVLTVEEAS